MFNDTIAAISTARGKGGVAMIRISGDRAIEVGEKMFEAKKPLSQTESNRAVYGKIHATVTDHFHVSRVYDGIDLHFRDVLSDNL